MKRIPVLPALVLIFLLCGANTCTEEGNRTAGLDESSESGSIDSIRIAFGSLQPGEEFLRENEAAAIQKLSDFADYLNIASDRSLDTTFRRQAADLAVKSFINAGASARALCRSYGRGCTIEDLAAACTGNSIPYSISITAIKITEPLTLRNDSSCSGRMKFVLGLIPQKDSNTFASLPEEHSVTFVLSLKEKSFGETTLKVWTLRLSDIE